MIPTDNIEHTTSSQWKPIQLERGTLRYIQRLEYITDAYTAKGNATEKSVLQRAWDIENT